MRIKKSYIIGVAVVILLAVIIVMGVTKPDARMFHALLEALRAEPKECLFVDDRAGNVQAARALGLHGVQMCRDESAAPPLWDGPVVHNLAELNQWLEARDH